MHKIIITAIVLLFLTGCPSMTRDKDIASQLVITTYMGGDVRIKYTDFYNVKEFSLGLGGKEDYTVSVERSPKNIMWPRNTAVRVKATFLDGYECQNNNFIRAPGAEIIE